MAPMKSVPAALHSELSEYASLLRAIRTNSTLDIVPQLSRANAHVGSSDYDSGQGERVDSEEETQLDDREASNKASEATQSRDTSKKRSKGKVQDKSPSKCTKRSRRKLDEADNWTRWPLLKEHCPLPEWSFDEEIMAIAEQCIRSRTSVSQEPKNSEDAATSRVEDSKDHDDDFNDFTLPPAHLSGLTLDAASKLTSILSLLASHRLRATFTKHGRLAPMSWLDVLEIVGIAGIFDFDTVEGVKNHMEDIFGQSQSQIVTRMHVLEASRRALAEAEASFGQDLSIIQPPSSRRRTKRKRGNTPDLPADSQGQDVDDDETPG